MLYLCLLDKRLLSGMDVKITLKGLTGGRTSSEDVVIPFTQPLTAPHAEASQHRQSLPILQSHRLLGRSTGLKT